jgi:hypothetical protein
MLTHVSPTIHVGPSVPTQIVGSKFLRCAPAFANASMHFLAHMVSVLRSMRLSRIRSLFTVSLVMVALCVVQQASAQDFAVFATPSKHLVLADEKKGEATFIGGQYLDGPLVAVRDGTPYVVVIGPDLGIWMRTQTSEWRSLGGKCTRLVGLVNTPNALALDAVCSSPSEVWSFPIAPPGAAKKSSAPSTTSARVLTPQFIDDRFAVYKNPAKEAVVVDLESLKVHALKGGLLDEPEVLMMGGEPTLFVVGLDHAIWTRSISQPWRSLGGKSDVITSVALSASGSDVTIVIPGESADTVLSRTLNTGWRETSPFADYPIDIASITGNPSDTLGPVTQVDKYIESFIDAWGDDIVTLRGLKTQAEFEAVLPSLKTTVLETKLIQRFASTPLKEILPKLLMAFPRSKYSDGAAAAMRSYLQTLGQNKAGVRTSFATVIKDFPDDPIADQRGVLLDLFSRVPGITDTFRVYLVQSLNDKNQGVAPGALTVLGRKYFAVMLSHALLATLPTPAEAQAAVENAIKTPIDADQEKDLKAALERYLDYADSFLVCSSSGCTKRPEKGASCSAASPCVVGLQCFKGTCSEFGEKGEACGPAAPFCHPLLTCAGSSGASNMTCVERAKLNESCKERSCQYGLSCLKRLGICVDTAKEGEACAGISKPCVDGATLACVKGYCKKKSARDGPCSSEYPCLEPYICSAPQGGVCLSRSMLGQSCSPSLPCEDGLTCFRALGAVGSTSGKCVATVGLGKPCGMAAFCDESQGLFCGSQGTCRRPGIQSEYCAQDGECTPGLMCNSGFCSASVGAGAKCQMDKHCKDGFICSAQSALSGGGTCIAKGGEGAPCPCAAGYSCVQARNALGGAVCRQDIGPEGECGDAGRGVCQAGLECRRSGSSAVGICKAPPRGGEPCSKNGVGGPVCGPGFFCNGGFCQAGLGEGGECSGPWAGKCAEGYSCQYQNGRGTCSSSCLASQMNWSYECNNSVRYACRQNQGLWFQASYSCVLKLPFGAACSPTFNAFSPPCMNELFCSPTIKTCQFRSRRGEACSSDGSQPCELDLNCRNGRCG